MTKETRSPVYTVKEAAELLDIPARVVRRLAQDGHLPGVVQTEGKHGRPVWRLSEASLQALRELPSAPAGPRPVWALPAAPAAADAASATGQEAPLPWHAVQLLLAAERERAQTLEQSLQRAAHSEAMLHEQLRAEREEVLRLRAELSALRQQVGAAAPTAPAAQNTLVRKSAQPPRVAPELADRPTEPIDLEQFRLSLSQSESKRQA